MSRSVSPRQRTIGVAIPIPEPWGGELQQWRQRFGDSAANAIPTHVTLLPPTGIADPNLPDIEEHLLKVAADEQPFDIWLRGTGSFRPVSPVVFVQLADGVGACERLEAKVRSSVLHRRLSYPYHPHVTVAHDLSDTVLDTAFDTLSAYDARFEVCGFSLYEHLRGVWRPRRDYRFGGDPRCGRGARPPGRRG